MKRGVLKTGKEGPPEEDIFYVSDFEFYALALDNQTEFKNKFLFILLYNYIHIYSYNKFI